MATNFDIWAEIRHVYTILGIGITTKHVPAHQDDTVLPPDELTPQAVINIAMDKAAELIRMSLAPTPPIPIFASSAVAIIINNAVVTDTICGNHQMRRIHLQSILLEDWNMI